MAGNEHLARRAVRRCNQQADPVRPHLQARPRRGSRKAPAEPILEPGARDHRYPPSSPGTVPGYRYRLDDFLADVNTGHKVKKQRPCSRGMPRHVSRARAESRPKPVGEVEFAAGVAAIERQRHLRADSRAAPASSAMPTSCWAIARRQCWRPRSSPAARHRFKGIPLRRRLGRRRPGDRQQPRRPRGRACIAAPNSAPGLKQLFRLGLSFDAWIFHHPARRR